MRQCFVCKEFKHTDEFHTSRYLSYCKVCKREYDKERREQNRDKFKDRDLRRYYNITLEDYQHILAAQGGVCGICKTDDPGAGNHYFAVDHDHNCCQGNTSCGSCIRGLLCKYCNNCAVTVIDAGLVEAVLHYVQSSVNLY